MNQLLFHNNDIISSTLSFSKPMKSSQPCISMASLHHHRASISFFYNNCRILARSLANFYCQYIISGQTHENYNLCDIDATSESTKFEKSICHFLTNRKRPLFLLANKRARRIMNLVASDWINFSFSRIFVSRFDLILSPIPFCYCKKQIDVSFFMRLSCYWQWILS